MQDTNKFKLGLFVTLSLIVFVAAIASMGIFDSLKPKAHLATFVEESVQGLTMGSSVKYKGVPIGRISDISIITENQVIRIDIQIDLTKFRQKIGDSLYNQSKISREAFYSYLQGEVRKGLTCRIEPDGITGIKYVEMDFFKDANPLMKEEIVPVGVKNNVFYMPSTPSMMANLRLSVFEILASLASIDFKGISAQAVSLLEAANKTIRDANLSALSTNMNAAIGKLDIAIENFNTSLSRKKMDKTIADIDEAFRSVRVLSDNLNKIADRSSIPETTSSIRVLSDSLKDSNSSVRESLQKLNDAIDAVTDLIQYVNDNPSSVLRGKGKEPIFRQMLKNKQAQ
ncbi:MAG: Paraquat-inducible protein B [Lentisphaerae bacterium ADurb.Bin242]|nr:MAG: Paraquat-inducible protein B [Lentisphaerae bacterium ADurb.Bin242]